MRVTPATVSLVRAADGKVLYTHQPEMQSALDPRVNYLMVSLMQEVLRSGTGASVRAHGFTLPAAGKTGTSHDGWFAGFTSQLLCVVWVGFDDNRELNLEGAKSALPIWAELMKRASKMLPYRDVKAFSPPPGVVTAPVCVPSADPDASGNPATTTKTEIFISGTEPTASCEATVPPVATSVADRVVDPITSANTPAALPTPPATAPPSAPVPATGGPKTILPVTSGGRGQ
jgi:penicillin-binding protein 1B